MSITVLMSPMLFVAAGKLFESGEIEKAWVALASGLLFITIGIVDCHLEKKGK